MAKRDLGFALLSGFCTAYTAAAMLILKQWIITAARAGKFSIFLNEDLNGNACKCQRNKNYS